MPAWLQAISRVNPLTYEVDALRALMVRGGTSAFGIGVDLLVLIGANAILMAIAARLYPRVVT
jgi:ABC-2 type transport system permease protein